jgi:hypothetical protein
VGCKKGNISKRVGERKRREAEWHDERYAVGGGNLSFLECGGLTPLSGLRLA